MSTAEHRLDVLVDAGVALVLAALAVASLGNVFAGPRYLAVGAGGALLAVVLVLAVPPARRDPLVALGMLIPGFVLGSAIALPDLATAGPLPTPETALGLLAGAVDGWQRLLSVDPLLSLDVAWGVPPYMLGYVSAGAGLVLARTERSPLLPALPALLALFLGFLLGTAEAVAGLALGAAVLVVALGWGAVRGNRPRRVGRHPHWPRILSGTAMLAIVALAGTVIGPRLPGVGGAERVDLRDEPVLDWSREPSPLQGYRRHILDWRDEVLFRVEGLPRDARIRLATMDSYREGSAWVVTGSEGVGSGRFEPVGESVTPMPEGEPATVRVAVAHDRRDSWLPTVGAMRRVERFDGDRRADLAGALRYDRASLTAAVSGTWLRAGDAYTLDTRVPRVPAEREVRDRRAAAVALSEMPPLPEPITRRATALTIDRTLDYDKARALADSLRDGTPQMPTWYSDGGEGAVGTAAASAPGHSLARLVTFVEARRGLVGNAEQYAATMAVMARFLGLPARVVMGFRPPAPAGTAGAVEVRGREVDAWVEIAFEGIGWVPFDPTPPRERKPPESPTVTQREVDLAQQEPPPPTFLRVPESLPDLVPRPPDPPRSGPSALATLFAIVRTGVLITSPVWVVAAVAGGIAGAKVLRARRRRRRGTPAQRLAGAWWELCDRCRDLGVRIPVRATRREVARQVAPVFPAAGPLALRIDEAMFDRPDPDGAVAESVWERLETDHRKLLDRMEQRRRFRVVLSLASLRPRRWQR